MRTTNGSSIGQQMEFIGQLSETLKVLVASLSVWSLAIRSFDDDDHDDRLYRWMGAACLMDGCRR